MGISSGSNVHAALMVDREVSARGQSASVISGASAWMPSSGPVTLNNNNVQNWNGDFTFTGNQNLNLGTGAASMASSNGEMSIS